MTLRGIPTAQLPLQARWTSEARLVRASDGICTRQNPARCFDQLWEPINALYAFLFQRVLLLKRVLQV